jgi:hypothetical protein
MPMPGFPPPQYGRAPSMPYSNQPYAMPGYAGQPVAGNWNPVPQHMPVMASMAPIPKPAQAPVRPPVIRLQAPETLLTTAAAPPPVRLSLPSPAALGIK